MYIKSPRVHQFIRHVLIHKVVSRHLHICNSLVRQKRRTIIWLLLEESIRRVLTSSAGMILMVYLAATRKVIAECPALVVLSPLVAARGAAANAEFSLSSVAGPSTTRVFASPFDPVLIDPFPLVVLLAPKQWLLLSPIYVLFLPFILFLHIRLCWDLSPSHTFLVYILHDLVFRCVWRFKERRPRKGDEITY